MTTIDFSDDELQALIQLIDISVKAQGLNVAEAAVILAKKVRESAAGPPPEVDSSPQFADSVEAPAEIPEEE
tara:strand:- start:710 stop:925 length:216 start_codon:yes stop_codon:yes gene_type:complete